VLSLHDYGNDSYIYSVYVITPLHTVLQQKTINDPVVLLAGVSSKHLRMFKIKYLLVVIST
jgi:hypothetical protein